MIVLLCVYCHCIMLPSEANKDIKSRLCSKGPPTGIGHGQSNVHVTDDVRWLWKVKLVTPIRFGLISRKRLELDVRLQKSTNRKWHVANRMVTWPMTSHDPRKVRVMTPICLGPNSRRCYLATIAVTRSAKWCVIEQKLLLTAYRKSHTGNRLVPKWMTLTCLEVALRSCQPLRRIYHWISRKPLEIETWFQKTIDRKWPMGNQIVTAVSRNLDLQTSNLFPHAVTLVMAMLPLNSNFLQLSYFEKIGCNQVTDRQTDSRTDGRGVTMWPLKEDRIIREWAW